MINYLKQLLKSTIARLLFPISWLILSGCCGESPLPVEPPYDPPGLQEGYCPVTEQWYFIDDCGVCHGRN